MPKIFTWILLLFCSFMKINAQNSDSINNFILPKTNQQLAFQKGLPYHIYQGNNFMVFNGFYPSGIPKYYTTHNLIEAKMSRTNYLWNESIGYTGSGMKIALWDGGSPRKTHEALTNKVDFREKIYSESYHSTHVAGTLAGRNINKDAIGMSFDARIISYDFDNDDSEILKALLIDNLLVSNHSYGFIGGWSYLDQFGGWTWWGDTTIDSQLDYKYGYYDEQARDWDKILYDHPYYLMLKSSGNDRGRNIDSASNGLHKVYDESSDNWVLSNTPRAAIGKFDCINGGGLSKNTLTIGSIRKLSEPFNYDSIEISKFSCTGPTDDGRIKPDLVGVGEGVYSALEKNDADYGEISGTSMATPHIAGSILLLQQKYQDLFGVFMYASTLKGLVIHHALDLGNPGPDYLFGWGFPNLKLSSDHLTNAFKKEKSLMIEKQIKLSETHFFDLFLDGTDSLKTTLCWTDTSGEISAPALNNRTPKLINNLDLTVLKLDNAITYFPYKLNPDFPDNIATQEINNVDNVEKIENISDKGWYRISVDFKTSKNTSTTQLYSLLVSGLAHNYCAGITTNTGNILDSFEFISVDKSYKNYANISWHFMDNGIDVLLNGDSSKYLFTNTGIYEIDVRITDKNKIQNYVCRFSINIGNSDKNLLPKLLDSSEKKYCEQTEINSKKIFSANNFDDFSATFFGKDTFKISNIDTNLIFYKFGNYDVFVSLKNTDGTKTYYLKNYLQIIQKHKINIQNMLDSACENNSVLLEPSPSETEVFYNNQQLNKTFLPADIGTGNKNLLLKLETKYGCIDSLIFPFIVLPAPPIPNVTYQKDELTTDGSGVITWYFNDNFLSNDRTIPVAKSGIYKVGIKTTSDGCETFSERKIYFAASVKDIKNIDFKIYPNPSKGNLTIAFEKEIQFKTIEIYDINGSMVKEIPFDLLHQNIEIKTELPSGIYYLNIKSDTHNWIEKIVITD